MESLFGKNLKKIRQSQQLTQEELSQKVGVHANHISRYERGDSSPTAETLIAFADALGVSIDELVSGDRKQQLLDSFRDIELLQLFKKIEGLEEAERLTVKQLLDAFIFKHETLLRLGR